MQQGSIRRIYQEELQEDNRGSGAMMEQYCTDLTERAAEGKMDPVVGRNQEIYRLMEILSRRTKNNPMSGWRTGSW